MNARFSKALEEIEQNRVVVDLKPGEKMPDINDLSQFPNYAAVLKKVKEEEERNR